MSDFFLTPEEVEEMTEYTRKKDQCRFLSEHGIRFIVSRTGRPKVPRAVIYEHCKIGDVGVHGAQPDIAALERLMDGT